MMKCFRFGLIFAAILSIATGCQTINDLAGTESSPTPAAQVPIGAAQPQPASVAPVVSAAATGTSFSNMDSERLIALWGEPNMKRKDIGSELWTYGKPNAKCSILVYVYPSKDGRKMVARGEATPGGPDENAVIACARANDLPSLKPVS